MRLQALGKLGLFAFFSALLMHTLAHASVIYDYDDLGRLKSVTYERDPEPDLSITYDYDAAGNRTTVVTVGENSQPPALSNLELSGNHQVSEDTPGAVIGDLSVNGLQGADTATFMVVDLYNKFEISGNTLKLKATEDLDYEELQSYSVTVTASAQTGAGAPYTGTQESFSIAVLNDNASEGGTNTAPTGLALTTSSVAENDTSGPVIGTLSATDPDDDPVGTETFTYSITAGDTSLFEIVGSSLKLKSGVSLDYETTPSYQVTIQVADTAGATYPDTFTITVTDDPSDNGGSGPGVIVTPTESSTPSTWSGGFTVNLQFTVTSAMLVGSDADAWKLEIALPSSSNSFTEGNTYMTGGYSSADFSQLNGVGTFYVDGASTNPLTVGSTVTFKMQSHDTDYNLSAFTFTFTDLDGGQSGGGNNAPTAIALSASSVAENNTSGPVIGTLTASDPDSGETFTYSITAGDTSLFEIVVSSLKLKSGVSLDYETTSSYQLTIQVADTAGATYPDSFTITVTDDPSDNGGGGGPVNLFDVTNYDPSFEETYTLPWYVASGTGERSVSEANTGSKSLEITSISYMNSWSNRTVSVTAGNTYCVRLYGRSSSLTDYVAVGLQESTGPSYMSDDSGAVIPSGASDRISSSDTGSWKPVGVCKQASSSGDWRVRIEQSGTGVAYFDDVFVCEGSTCADTAGGGNGAPTGITLIGSSVAENDTSGPVIGTLSATDPDSGETFTYSITAGDTSLFEIVGASLKLKSGVSLDYETTSSYQLTIQVADAAGATYADTVTISVIDINEGGGNNPPNGITLNGSSVDENDSSGPVIGTLTANDPDSGETFIYSITVGDTSLFEIVGSTLKLKSGVSLDYETTSSYPLTIQVTDTAGASYSDGFTISVVDVNEGGITNLMPDPSFDQPYTTYWGTYEASSTNDPTFSNSSAEAYDSGGQSALISGGDQGSLARFNLKNGTITGVTPGETYCASVQVKTGSGVSSSDPVRLWLIYLRSDNGWSTNTTAQISAPNQDWTKAETCLQAPTDAASIRIDLRKEDSGDVYFDDVQVWEQ